MAKQHLGQWLIPFLFGLGIGLGIAWWLPNQFSLLIAPIVLLVMLLLKYLLEYSWPWEVSRRADHQ
jgi:hypothetical protein